MTFLNTNRNETIMPRSILQFFVFVALMFGLPSNALAVKWQALDGTSQYKVAYDEQSIRQNSPGLFETVLRFIPRGEAERRSAALEYKEKLYHSHLESYQINCSEQTALLSRVDIIGTSKARLKQLKGGSQPDQILPGSVLYNVAQRICPAPEDETESDGSAGVQTDEQAAIEDKVLSSDKLQLIENLQKKAVSKEATADTWKELGNIYFDTDQPEPAIKAYEHALSLRPNDTDALNDQGAMYRQTGNFQQALANFEKAFSIDPTNLESLYNSAYVYAFDLNSIPKALVLWWKYLELESKSETALQVRSFVEKYGK